MNMHLNMHPLYTDPDEQAEKINGIHILQVAEYLLTNIGWVKGHEITRDGAGKVNGYCLMGAINEATRVLNLCGLSAKQHQLLNNKCPNNDFVHYNDNQSTTVYDVIRLIRDVRDEIMDGPKTQPTPPSSPVPPEPISEPDAPSTPTEPEEEVGDREGDDLESGDLGDIEDIASPDHHARELEYV